MTDADSPLTPVAKTHAEANRLRKDIVLGEATDEARLVRFVVGPDGAVVPDVARKLPGRGMWVDATREAVSTAAKKGLFSRSAKTKLTAPADLADQVERLLVQAGSGRTGPCTARRNDYLRLRKGLLGPGLGTDRLVDRGVRRRR
jgi:predicted RNA-binding protein YlxR (DUF448 family)